MRYIYITYNKESVLNTEVDFTPQLNGGRMSVIIVS